MHQLLRASATLAWIVAAFLSSGRAEDRVYENAAHHFRLSVPADWEDMPKEMVQAASKAAATLTDASVNYIAGFQPKNGQYPYLLVQYSDQRLTLPVILHALSGPKADKELEKARKLVGNPRMRKPWIDEKRQAVLVSMEMEVFFVRTKALTASFPGREGMVQLNLYATLKTYEKDLPLLESIVDSFKFDAGYEYPGAVRHWGPGDFGGGVGGGAIGIVICIVVTAIYLAAKGLKRRWGKRAIE